MQFSPLQSNKYPVDSLQLSDTVNTDWKNNVEQQEWIGKVQMSACILEYPHSPVASHFVYDLLCSLSLHLPNPLVK